MSYRNASPREGRPTEENAGCDSETLCLVRCPNIFQAIGESTAITIFEVPAADLVNPVEHELDSRGRLFASWSAEMLVKTLIPANQRVLQYKFRVEAHHLSWLQENTAEWHMAPPPADIARMLQ